MSQESVPIDADQIAAAITEIWQGDLFKRREEAELLIGYIESVGGRTAFPEDHRGFTISVDADYGLGKSYFLRRFAKHLALSHPVAFVDAWSDDLADEPLTAIAATLKKALAPLILSSPTVKSGWDNVASKTGQVAKIVGKGLLKKGLGLLITGGAVEALDQLATGISDEGIKDIRKDVKDLSENATDGAVEAITKQAPQKLMANRIADFESGQAAIAELKLSLSGLVDTLADAGLSAPIVIVVDELDRCRPTYAIKLLEETKHLFDVPGIVFVFGMHAEQLSFSISGAYGQKFDGQSYLRRFINRHYSLAFPEMEPLVQQLLNANSIPDTKLEFLATEIEGHRKDTTAAMMIAMYMRAYGMTARDAFRIIDIIQTCVAVAASPLFMPLLLPKIIGHIKGLPSGKLPAISHPPKWNYIVYDYANETRESIKLTLTEAAEQFNELSKLSRSKIGARINDGDNLAYALIDYVNDRGMPGQNISSAGEYDRLLQRLSRFSASH